MLYFHSSKKKGYTLVEIISALAAFTIIMLAVTQIFGRGFTSYRMVKTTQNSLQAAQFALNLISKEIRTSSMVVGSPGGSSSRMVFYDYSQGRCIEYVFTQGTGTSGTVTRRAATVVPGVANPGPNDYRASCASHSFVGSASTLLTSLTGQAVSIVTSLDTSDPSGPRVGQVTMVLTVGTGTTSSSLQTTVSLRDFNYTGT